MIERIKWLVLLVFSMSLILFPSVYGYKYDVNCSDGFRIQADDYVSHSWYADFRNFSITNTLGSVKQFNLSYVGFEEPLVFYEFEERETNRVESVFNGYYNVSSLKNGSWVNDTFSNYTFSKVYEFSWEPAKSWVFDSNHPKYDARSSASINFGPGETKLFWIRAKHVFSANPLKFDINCLDPLSSDNKYRAGNSSDSFVDDINASISNATISAGSIVLGTSGGGGGGAVFVNEDFENNSLVQWGASSVLWINSTVPLNGSYSLYAGGGGAGDSEARVGDNYSINGEPFNISFGLKSFLAGSWAFIYLKSDAVDSIGAHSGPQILWSNDNTCPGVADSEFCYRNQASDAYVATGLHCNKGNTCNIIIEVNATKSGSTADTVFYLHVNDSIAGPFDTINSAPPSELYHLYIGVNWVSAYLLIDDLKIENASNTLPLVNETSKNSFRSKSFQFSNFLRRVELNVTELGDNPFNVSCDDGTTWSGLVTKSIFTNCPVMGKFWLYEGNVSGQTDVLFINASFDINAPPTNDSNLANNQSVYQRIHPYNVTVSFSDSHSDLFNVTFNWSVNSVLKRQFNISSVGGVVAFSDFLSGDFFNKSDNVSVEVWATDNVTEQSVILANYTLIADFPVTFLEQPRFNFTDEILSPTDINITGVMIDHDLGDNITYNVTLWVANGFGAEGVKSVSHLIDTTIAFVRNGTGINVTFLSGNFTGGMNVSMIAFANSSTPGGVGNVSLIYRNWTIVGTRISVSNLTQPTVFESIRNDVNWTGGQDQEDNADTNITYRLQFSSDNGSSYSDINFSQSFTNISWDIRGMVFNNSYRLRVRAEFGVNATGWNSTAPFTVGENRTVINRSDVSIYGNAGVRGSYGLFSNATLEVNVTPGLLVNISVVEFRITYPNGSIINTTQNGSRESGDALFNSSHRFFLRTDGLYTWFISANNSIGNDTVLQLTNGTFSVSDGLNILPSPQYLKVIDPDENISLNISIWHDSPENISFNVEYNLTNKTAFKFNFTTAQNIVVNGSVHNRSNPGIVVLEINASTSSVLVDGQYDGNITVTRIFDNNITVIPFVLGVNPPRGEITALDSSRVICDSLSSNCEFSGTYETNANPSFYFLINNTGAYNLSSCESHFFDPITGNNVTLSGGAVSIGGLSAEGNIVQNETASVTVSFESPTIGLKTASVEVTCHATLFGYVDSLSANPSEVPFVSVSFVGTSGSAAGITAGAVTTVPSNVSEGVNITGFVGFVCGDGVCEFGEGEDIFNCKRDCLVNLDTLFSLELFKQDRVLQVLAVLLVASILVIAYTVKPSKKKMDGSKSFGGF